MQQQLKLVPFGAVPISHTKMTGSSIELQADISSPELTKSAFKYALPEGAVLKDSLFGESKGISNRPNGGDVQ